MCTSPQWMRPVAAVHYKKKLKNSCTSWGDPESISKPLQLVLNWRISKEPKQKLMLQNNRT